MRLLFTALGIFLLYLSCIPCSDSNECNVKVNVKILASRGHEQHSHDKEACTPFCSCSCCSASAFYYPLIKTQTITSNASSEKFHLFNIAIDAEGHYSIWEPPQLKA